MRIGCAWCDNGGFDISEVTAPSNSKYFAHALVCVDRWQKLISLLPELRTQSVFGFPVATCDTCKSFCMVCSDGINVWSEWPPLGQDEDLVAREPVPRRGLHRGQICHIGINIPKLTQVFADPYVKDDGWKGGGAILDCSVMSELEALMQGYILHDYPILGWSDFLLADNMLSDNWEEFFWSQKSALLHFKDLGPHRKNIEHAIAPLDDSLRLCSEAIFFEQRLPASIFELHGHPLKNKAELALEEYEKGVRKFDIVTTLPHTFTFWAREFLRGYNFNTIQNELYQIMVRHFQPKTIRLLSKYLGPRSVDLPPLSAIIFDRIDSLDEIPKVMRSMREEFSDYRRFYSAHREEVRLAKSIGEQLECIEAFENDRDQLSKSLYSGCNPHRSVILRVWDWMQGIESPLSFGYQKIDYVIQGLESRGLVKDFYWMSSVKKQFLELPSSTFGAKIRQLFDKKVDWDSFNYLERMPWDQD